MKSLRHTCTVCLEWQGEGRSYTSTELQQLQAATHLGQRRVGVDVELDVLDLLPRRHRVGGLVDEVRRVQSEDVHAQDLARVLPAEPKQQNIQIELPSRPLSNIIQRSRCPASHGFGTGHVQWRKTLEQL